MKRILKDIADIHSGILLNKAINKYPIGNMYLLQIKDITDNGLFSTKDIVRIDIGKTINNNALLNENDILFKSKSSNFSAAVYNLDLKPAVASSHYLVLKVTENGILSEYLSWYLNQPIAQRYFKQNAAGTLMKIISKKVLEQLQIEIPDLEVQDKIIKVHRLHLQEKMLIEKIQQKRDQVINTKLIKAMNK